MQVAGEDEPRRAAHRRAADGVDGDVEPATGQADRDRLALRDEAFRARDRRGGARPGPAGERDPHAALPHDEIDAVARDVAELDVRAARKVGVRREAWSEVIDVGARERAEQHRVGVVRVGDAHDDALSVDLERPVAEEADEAHVDRHDARAVRVLDGARARARVGVDRHVAVTLPTRASDVHGHAPDAVAAHLGDRAVRVEHEHAHVAARLAGRQHEDDAVRADAEPAIAQGDGALRRHDALVPRVDDDEVVAQTLVFEKLHGQTPRNRARG